jgi:hypothetical protein
MKVNVWRANRIHSTPDSNAGNPDRKPALKAAKCKPKSTGRVQGSGRSRCAAAQRNLSQEIRHVAGAHGAR